MRSRFLGVLSSLLLIVAAAACGTAREPEEHEADPVAEAPAGAEEEQDAGLTGADSDRQEALSLPSEVYDFVGIEQGDTVLDLRSGQGFNTRLLAERVGPGGAVIAMGASPELESRVAAGEAPAQIELTNNLLDIEDGTVDAVLAVRAYHEFPDAEATRAELFRLLAPGGTVGVVEARLGEPVGTDMRVRRVGERTVIDEMVAAGFEYVGESDVLRRDDDDHGSYSADRAHMTDRMLLLFRKPE